MEERAASETYTHGHPEPVLRSHRWRTVENSAAYLVPRLVPGTRTLDVGCGPGTITADLAARVSPGAVVGVDTSADVVAAAAREHTASNLSFRMADVYSLDEPDDSYELVHAHQVLQHLADPVAALVEMRRVCRRGGTVAVRDADYAAMTWWPEMPGLERWLDVYRTVARGTEASPTPAGASRPGRGLPGSPTSTLRHRSGASPARRTARGGPRRGRSAPPAHHWLSGPWRSASRLTTTSPTARRPGTPGRATPTRGSSSSTARSWRRGDLQVDQARLGGLTGRSIECRAWT